MTIKIISMPPVESARKVDCQNCRAVLEYKNEDLEYSKDPREPGVYITCPCCKHVVWAVMWKPSVS